MFLIFRLTQQDKKSVESVCSAFSRLVDSYQNDPARLQEIASTELLTNLQQLVRVIHIYSLNSLENLQFLILPMLRFQLVVSPPMISTGTFITVLRMLSVMCSSCPELAITLLRQNIADTLLFLLTGSTVPNPQDEVCLFEYMQNVLCRVFYFIFLYCFFRLNLSEDHHRNCMK